MKIAGQSGAILAALKQHAKEVSTESDRRSVANKRVNKHITDAKREKQEGIQNLNERNADQQQVMQSAEQRKVTTTDEQGKNIAQQARRQVGLAMEVDSQHVGPVMEGGSQGAEPEAAASHNGSSLKQRVARWVENGAAIARKMVMPARLRPLPNVEMTAESFKAQSEVQKEWRASVAQTLGENRSPALRKSQHGMQLQAHAGKTPTQGGAEAALLPEKQRQLETLNAAVLTGDKKSLSSRDMMPARLRTLTNVEVTAESFKAKAEAQKEWSASVKQALAENRSPALRMIQHGMQLSLDELRTRTGKEPAQDTTEAAPVLPEKEQQLEECITQLETFNDAVLADDKETISSWDINQILQDSIAEINDSYLSTYTEILSKFSTFFSDFADFKSKISQYITAGEDGKLVVNSKGIMDELNLLINKYSDHALYPPEGKTASQEDAEKWAKEMDLPDSCIVSDGNGGYIVIMDTTPLITVRDSTYNTFGIGSKEVDSAQYQAWLSGFDMQGDKYQNFMQVMTQKYTTANSVFDNLIKVLSSTITSLLESDKSFFNI